MSIGTYVTALHLLLPRDEGGTQEEKMCIKNSIVFVKNKFIKGTIQQKLVADKPHCI